METTLSLETHQSIAAIQPEEWNACAYGDEWKAGPYPNPFISHAFLRAMEDSGSVGQGTGWQPLPVTLRDETDRLLACAPAYLKGDSYGEYVFDHAWADALHRAGGRYYPKLLIASPFSPVSGPRLLARDGTAETRARLAEGLKVVAQKLQLSSVHINFLPADEWHLVKACGYLQRMDQQFHWQNDGYGSFDEFLARLNARKRKEIRRERREALAPGISIEWLSGKAIKPEHWDTFFEFYTDTGNRKWGTPYLTRDFFHMLGERMAESCLLIMARREGRHIAGALNLIGTQSLFGRHWGCVEHHPFLHFEVCYYQAIDFAIARGLKTVEAGAQGGHKLLRGYEPTPTFSAHWLAHEGFYRAVEDYLRHERAEVSFHVEALRERTPFKRQDDC